MTDQRLHIECHAHGVVQWAGSQPQRDALAGMAETRHAVYDVRWRAGEVHSRDAELHRRLEEAMWHLLRAETSCYLYGGEAGEERAHGDLNASWAYIAAARRRLEC